MGTDVVFNFRAFQSAELDGSKIWLGTSGNVSSFFTVSPGTYQDGRRRVFIVQLLGLQELCSPRSYHLSTTILGFANILGFVFNLIK